MRAALAQHGFVVVRTDDPLAGFSVRMVERQPIRPLPGGRSFASTQGTTPLHTDSQDFVGAPPGLQIMQCVQAAREGGESVLVDGWALVADVARSDPALHRALFTEWRTQRFYFGDVTGPTVARKRGLPVLTHSPLAPEDAVGRALEPYLARAPRHVLAIATGETLLVDNHRMLHGRRAFADPGRRFLRRLAWLDAPLSAPHFDQPLQDTPVPQPEPLGARQRAVVAELVGGVPPAKLASREGIAEAELYRWRTAVYAREFAHPRPCQNGPPA